MKTVKVVIGANFGDEGKGLMTDYFSAQSKNCLIVMHNGGAQRGHTVITPEGYRHVFHHFSSGSYNGAVTYLAKEFIVNPILFRKEYEELSKNNIIPKIYINPNCKLTTIYDMLINQVIEADRGSVKHGSCGIGIYETLYRNHNGIDFKKDITINPLKMEVKEFASFNTLNQLNFLDYLRKNYVQKRFNDFGLKNIDKSFLNILNSQNVMLNFINDFQFMISHSEWALDDIIDNYENIIFENAQGLLLDQYNMDYFPHLTPSNTGMKNPTDILNAIDYKGIVEICYVSRTYLTRHGVGRFDSECSKKDINTNMVDITNVPNPFQDHLRYGFLNLQELDNRIMKDSSKYTSKFIPSISLALTHINEYDNNLYSNKAWCDLYDKYNIYFSTGMTRNNTYKLKNY